MEVVGAVASFIAIGQGLESALRLVNFVREIPEIESDFKALRREIKFIGYMLKVSQRVTSVCPDDNDSPLIEEAIQQLKEIEADLEKTASACSHAQGDKKGAARKRKWILEGKKIQKLHTKAIDARSNLQFALTCHLGLTMSVRQDQFSMQMHNLSQGFSSLTSTQSQLRIQTPEDLPDGHLVEDSRPIEIVEDDVGDTDAPRTQVEWQEPMPAAEPSTSHRAEFLDDGKLAELRDSLSRRHKGCPPQCSCRCHFGRTDIATQSWLRPAIGSWSVSFNVFPGLRRSPCTDKSCKRGARVALILEHQFPNWLWARAFGFKASYDVFCGLKYSSYLRPARRLRGTDSVWSQVEQSGEMFYDFIKNEPNYFPEDTDGYGRDIVEYILQVNGFDALEVLLKMWENILPEKGLSRNVAYQINNGLEWDDQLDDRKINLLHQARRWADDGLEWSPTKLHQAISEGACLQGILQEQPWTINFLGCNGDAPIHVAARLNQVSALKQLIASGADIDLRDWMGWTPLMYAAKFDNLETVQCLLQAKCCVGMQSGDGQTALHVAMESASPAVVAMLMVAGASASARDSYGHSPLHSLARSQAIQEIAEVNLKIEHLRMAKYLDLEAVDVQGWTPTMVAAAENNLPVLRCLVEAGGSLHHVTKYSWHLLHISATSCDADVLHYLTGLALSGINTDLVVANGFSPWGFFQWVIRAQPGELISYNYRAPNPHEIGLFVQLYKDIRNRNIQHDMRILEEATQALRIDDKVTARARLAPLIKQKEEWKREDLFRMFRAIDGQIRADELLPAIEAIEDNIYDMKEQMECSPWEQWSDGTPSEEEDDDDENDEEYGSDEETDNEYGSDEREDNSEEDDVVVTEDEADANTA